MIKKYTPMKKPEDLIEAEITNTGPMEKNIRKKLGLGIISISVLFMIALAIIITIYKST